MGKVHHLPVVRFRIFTNHTKREPAMRIFLIIIWGIMAFISVTGTLYIITNYEIQRWRIWSAAAKARISDGLIRPRLF